MKIVLALAIAVMLLAVMAPIALAADSGTTVYVSVSVDGELLVAAQPITVTDTTVEGVIKAAHAEFYSGGESGYTAGIDPMFNIYLVTQCWGITATPYVIVNDAPLGSDPTVIQTVDAVSVAANDNIIICTGSDMMNNPVTPVSLTSTLSGDSATVTATAWTLDFTTFTYSSTPLANANVIDPTTGESLGTTDADGSATVTVPESGVVAIEGLAAINVKTAPAPAPAAPTSAAAGPATVYVSVSVDGELLVAAEPISLTDTTVDAAIKAAHEEFYSGGESGYTAGIDPTFNMYLVTQCWGITATPYVIVNDAPLGADQSKPMTVDTYTLVDNDNIIICTGSDMMNNPVTPVSLTSTLSGDSATVTATAWTLDFTTFMYSSAPLANANVIDPTTGESLGTTDADGSATVTVPESGVVAIEGLAAINVTVTPAPAPAAPTSAAPPPGAPAAPETPLLYENTIQLIIVLAIILVPIAVIVAVKIVRQSRSDKESVGVAPMSPFAGPAPSFGGPAPASAAAPKPISGPPTTVYVSVSVDGGLLVAAKPVTVTDTTVEGVIKAAHKEFYSGGESGYTAGIDPTFNMFLISRCWGVQATPYVILNDTPLGADPTKVPATADVATVAANDNIIICTSSDPMNRPAKPVSLKATLSGDSATLTATAWTLDFTTFTYSSTPLAKAKVVDPTAGASLGTTDANGQITVTVPKSGVVAIEGLAAIAVTSKNKQSKGNHV